MKSPDCDSELAQAQSQTEGANSSNREAVKQLSPGLLRFAATLGSSRRETTNPNGVVSHALSSRDIGSDTSATS